MVWWGFGMKCLWIRKRSCCGIPGSITNITARACERSWAARIFAPRLCGCLLLRSIAPSLKVIPDSSAQIPLSAHLKFHSAPVKSLHARSNLKEGAISDVAPIWPVCLLFDIFYKLHFSTNDPWWNHRSGLWINTCSVHRLYFARSTSHSLRALLRSHVLITAI